MTYPEELSGKDVQGKPSGAFGEDSTVKSDEALEDAGVGILLARRRGAKVHRASGIRRAVIVLGTSVAKVDGVGVNDGALAMPGMVVHDGGARETR